MNLRKRSEEVQLAKLVRVQEWRSKRSLRRWRNRLKKRMLETGVADDDEGDEMVAASTNLVLKRNATRVLRKISNMVADILKQKPVGVGSSASVFRVRLADEPDFPDLAVKVVIKPRRRKCELRSEFMVLEHLNNELFPHAPKLIGRFSNFIGHFLVTEFVEGTSPVALHLLDDTQKRRALHILDWMHSLKVRHSDLHEGNLIISKANEITIIDFGNALLNICARYYKNERKFFVRDLVEACYD